MNMIKINNQVFCNGGEKYQKEDWKNLCNVSHTWQKHTSACIDKSGLICKVNKEPRDIGGNLIKEEGDSLYAIWVPKNLPQAEKIEAYFAYSDWLCKAYEEYLIQHHIVGEDFFRSGKLCYFGCEEEYDLEM